MDTAGGVFAVLPGAPATPMKPARPLLNNMTGAMRMPATTAATATPRKGADGLGSVIGRSPSGSDTTLSSEWARGVLRRELVPQPEANCNTAAGARAVQ